MFWKRQKTRTVTFSMNVRFATDALHHSYEQPVEEFLATRGSGKLAGHGALYTSDCTEVLSADFSVELTKFDKQDIDDIVKILEEAGAPLGCVWCFDDVPNEKTEFGTLDGLMVRFANLQSDFRGELEEFFHRFIDNFHENHADTAGFQGAVFSATKATASFHGFNYDDMKRWLEEAIKSAGDTFDYEIERTTGLIEGTGKDVS